MGIFAKILAQLPLLPGIISGIEYISKEAGTPGATKKQMALDALGLATGVAGVALPGFAPEIQAASELASGAIDLIVKGFNVAGWGLLIAGGVLSLAEGVAIADANSTGIPFEQSPVGKIEAMVPNPTPFEPGTLLLIAGASLLWIVPFVVKKA